MKKRQEAMKKSRRGLIFFSSSMLSPTARAVRELVAKMPPLPVPPTVRECASQGLLPYGLSPSRTAMSPAHTLELVGRYPGLYCHADDKPVSSSEPFASEGFACGDGWFRIIDRLSAKLVADPNLVVSQLKQKNGLLRVYFDLGELASPKIEAMTDAALRKACKESRRICEVCGVMGVYEERGDERLGVLCEPCNWLNDMEMACQFLTDIGKRWISATRARREILLEAGRRHVQHLGQAASHQSPRRRAKFPAIDWKRLDGFQPIYVNDRLNQFGPKELRKYIRDEVPLIKEALR
jgi:uncharacterized protein with HEPN domain